MTRVPLTLACGDYDRVWPLADGRVRPDGIDLDLVRIEPEECFSRMLANAEFDASEMSLSSYAIAHASGDDRFVGVPVFLSRSFRHSTLYVRKDCDLTDARDLAGKRIGVPEYQLTAAVWARALLRHDFDVDTSDIVWCTGGLEEPGRAERPTLQLPEWVHVEHVEQPLSQALVDGSIDALMAARVPSVYRAGSRVRRLWPDYAAREADYFTRTGIFPIMHMMVVRADVHRAHPWVVCSLYKAFDEAKRIAVEGAADRPALRYTIPFLLDTLERQAEILGEDPWSYGYPANRETLDTFAGYLAEQGLVSEPPAMAELFAPATLTDSGT